MPITGTDLAITPARAGELRSGAGRSGWPYLLGIRVPLYALSGVARSGATRSGYHSPATFIAIGGVQYGTAAATPAARILVDSLSIVDALDEAPNTATMRAIGFTPTVGQDVVVTLGSINNLTRHFAGKILRAQQGFLGKPEHVVHDVSLIDPTWGLGKRKVIGRYTGSATTIARALVATYAPGYTTIAVEEDLDTVDGGITFTNQNLDDCLTQLAKRVCAYWYVDYHADVHLFVGTEDIGVTPPQVVNRVNPTFKLSPGLTVDRDLSQMITRVYVEGGGGKTLETIGIGETIIAVENAEWYEEAGGTVIAGPQRITYTGRSLGGGGGLVGPGAAPTAFPALAAASGAGIESGAHEYGVSFVTPAGESLVGPTSAITAGPLAAPASAPTLSARAVGTGPSAGTHQYGVTFVNASGETTPGPVLAVATTLTPAPTTAPTPTAVAGTGIESGAHDYAVAFVTPVGETTPSAIGGAAIAGPVVLGALVAPTTAPTPAAVTGLGVDGGAHDYAITFKNAAGETTRGPIGGAVTLGTPGSPPLTPPGPLTVGLSAAGVLIGLYSYAVTFVNALGETTISAPTTRQTSGLLPPSSAPTFTIAPEYGTPIAAPTAAAIVTRTPSVGEGAILAVWDFAYTFKNAIGETVLGPTVTVDIYANTTAVSLSNVQQSGHADVTKRWVYRRSSIDTPGTFFAIAEIADNVTTTLADATVTRTGIVAPTTNTTANGPILGTHDFAVTFWNAAGQTTPGPIVSAIVHTPTTSLTLQNIPLGPSGTTKRWIFRRASNGANPATYFAIAEIADNTTTTLGNTLVMPDTGSTAPTSNTTGGDAHALSAIPLGPSGTTGRRLYRTIAGATGAHLFLALINNNTDTTYVDNAADASLGAPSPATNTSGNVTLNHISLTGIATGASGTVSRGLYRRSAGLDFKLVTTIPNNHETTYTDTAANAALGAAPPGSNTTGSTVAYNQIALSAIPLGDANVSSRRLYRRSAGLGLKFLATIANNVATTYLDAAANASLGAAPLATSTAHVQRIGLANLPLGGPLVTARKLYGTVAGGAQLKLVATLNATDTTYTVVALDGALGADAPIVNTAAANQVAVSGIPIGSATVTARRVYRTRLGSSTLYLVTTIGDNVTTTYLDDAADASIVTLAPVADLSGLTQPEGNVPAGASTLIVAGTGAFRAGGGWAVIGNGQQVIRYTAITGSTLSGIPPTGVGAIVATIAYNSTVTAAPLITGIPAAGAGSILYPILRGEDVNLLAIVDDVAAQTALAALIGGDGIQEDVLQDRRLAFAEATARGEAHLAMRNQIDVTLRYRTQDINTRAGQTVSVNLGAPTNVVADFKIQHVTISTFHATTMPFFDVTASTDRFSFEDLLRMARL